MTYFQPVLLCALASLLGLPTIVAAEESAPVLQVKPQLCIIDRYTSSCDASFLILWQSTPLGDFCLHVELPSAPLKCWSSERNGEHRERRNAQQDFSYLLAVPNGTRPLATAKVEVMRIDSADRRRQRRGRHIWDVL